MIYIKLMFLKNILFRLYMNRSIYIFLYILVVTIQAIPSASAKDYRIISVEQDIDMGYKDNKETPATDFYLNAGHKDDIEIDMLLDVYRPKLIEDPFTLEKKEIKILIGKVKVIDVHEDISIARIDSLESFGSNPIIRYQTVMIGDHLEPVTISLPKKSAMIIPSNILFDFDNWQIKPQAFNVLIKVAKLIKSPDDILIIKGHTCNKGNKDYNLRLSRKRAESVAAFFRTIKNIHSEQIISVGYGDERPITSNDTEEGRVKNRRVEIKIIPSNGVMDDTFREKKYSRPRSRYNFIKF